MRFTTYALAKAVGVEPYQLSYWKARGILSVNQNVCGKYSEIESYQVAILKLLDDLGISADRKRVFCENAAYGLKNLGDQLRFLHFIIFSDGCAVRFNDMALTEDRPALGVVSVNVDVLRQNLRAKLHKATP